VESAVVDELHVDIMPVLLGSGLRSFESARLERVRLEKISGGKSAREQASESV
jgi:hypothetical protein